MALPILFRDARFVVLDKPAGLPVHPGPRGGASVEDAFPTLSRRRDGPWLAHRLDADTAGCLVVALRRAALLAAQQAFASGAARKTYWAVVVGGPEGEAGSVDAPLAKRSDRQGWRMVVAADGQRAVTDWCVLGRGAGVAWLELRPRTGRTHQVRAHCAHLGCPVLGDPLYGGGEGRLHLLARAIALPLDPPLAAEAPVPPHMRAALAACGWAACGWAACSRPEAEGSPEIRAEAAATDPSAPDAPRSSPPGRASPAPPRRASVPRR
jgi:tRNA pseudouridine32 synthase / 23S rRNA pseudouridine746 synthase